MIEAGSKFGRWTVLERAEDYVNPKGFHFRKYFVLCECGTKKSVRESSLLSGESKSCGCYCKEIAGERNKTHGMSGHPLFRVWFDMNRRCYDSKRKDYIHYGGRGISICEQWRRTPDCSGFRQFLIDMEQSHSEGLEIERIDVNGNYCPENCKWATHREQIINRRHFDGKFNARFIEFRGETLCISMWADKLGINSKILMDRITKLGWDIERAFTTPPNYKSLSVFLNGEYYSFSKIFRIPANVSNYASKLGVQTAKLLAGMFKGVAEVSGVNNKQQVVVQPTEDYSHLINKFVLNKEFAEKLRVMRISLDDKHFE